MKTSGEYAIEQAEKDIDLCESQLSRISEGKIKVIGDLRIKELCLRKIEWNRDLINFCKTTDRSKPCTF